jgi:D-glycero-D-manno-heptose 1,7-bisphosphate phosphatase
MKRAAVFFDRDNTLIACDEYLGDSDKVELVSGAAGAVARAKRLGYAVVTISNQSGVARGYFNEDAVRAVNARMDELLRASDPDAIIDRHEICPYHPDASIELYRRANSPMRKPAPGMLYSAAEALDLDLSRSWLIGDAPRDIEAGDAAGCKTILFIDPALQSSPAASSQRRVEPQYICSTLAEAMDFIEKNTEASMKPAEDQAEAPREDGVALDADADQHAYESAVADSSSEIEPPTEAKAQAVEEVFSVIKTTDEPLDPLATSIEASHRMGILEDAGTEAQDSDEPPTDAPAQDQADAAPVTPRRPWLEAAAQARRAGASSQDSSESTISGSEPAAPTSKLESIASDILHELRRQREQPVSDFSVSKLLGGVMQMIVLFVLFTAYFTRADPQNLQSILLLALVLQTMTIALLIMGKQK